MDMARYMSGITGKRLLFYLIYLRSILQTFRFTVKLNENDETWYYARTCILRFGSERPASKLAK
jgi:hypothetical protein